MDHAHGPTRQELDPLVGHYGFVDPRFKECSFALAPSLDGGPSGAVTTRNCEALLPQLAKATRWQSGGVGYFMLWSGRAVIGRFGDTAERRELTIFTGRFPTAQLAFRRLDAPNLRRPARLAAGWWTFSINGAPSANDNRLALLMNGRIGDASQSPRRPLVDYAGGRWRADEGGVSIFGKDPWLHLRYEGSGKKLISGNYMMVQD